MAAEATVARLPPPLDDPYSLSVHALGTVEVISGLERFELVSSLYGPGNLACWFFLLVSVIVSWAINPSCSRKDSITNDFIAALSLPIVAVADFFHQIYQHTGMAGFQDLFTSLDRDNVRAVAVIEASLTVCEDFVTWAAILFSLAVHNGNSRRMFLVVVVCWLCLSVEVLLWSDRVPFRSSLLVRPFFFHLTPLLGVVLCWHLLTVFVYLVEVLLGMLLVLTKTSQPEVESGKTPNWRIFWPGRFSRWMSGCSALVVGMGAFWIKYVWTYPLGINSARFVPRSAVGISDLDQIVAAIAGVVALLFSLLDAFRERKKAKIRAQQETRRP